MTRKPSPEDDWIFDPTLASIDRSLQRELREEAQEVEESIATSELRGRTFQDVALEARNRGDVVTVSTQRRAFQGQLQYAARDFVTLSAATFEVDIQISAIDFLKVIGPGRGGQAMQPGSGTFEMRLLERESPVERVEIGFVNREEILLGQIPTVGQDHIVVIDDQRNQWVIPSAAVAFVIRRPVRGNLNRR